ncbi:MAG: hypothetical protein R3C12_12610 [Planctomycetaceae bacterium]
MEQELICQGICSGCHHFSAVATADDKQTGKGLTGSPAGCLTALLFLRGITRPPVGETTNP